MEVQAQARWVRTAPRKVKLVADTLKGLPVAEALTLCKFMPKAAARDVAKVIRSAQANAEHNFNLDKDDLVIKDLRVESGVTMKRAQHRAMGRYFSVFKRTSHITAVIEDRPGAVKVVRRLARTVPPSAPPAGRAPQPGGEETRRSEPKSSTPATPTSGAQTPSAEPAPGRGRASKKEKAEGLKGEEAPKKGNK